MSCLACKELCREKMKHVMQLSSDKFFRNTCKEVLHFRVITEMIIS